jgi:hypothetical protein
MLFYDCYEKSFLSLSIAFSLSLFSHLHRRLICLAISDGVMLTVCCSFPFVVVISTARAREREREIDLRSAIREREKKKKYYRNGQSHHLSHVCMCRLTCESILSANVHTHKQNQSTAEENVIASERECAIKKDR